MRAAATAPVAASATTAATLHLQACDMQAAADTAAARRLHARTMHAAAATAARAALTSDNNTTA